MAVNTNPDVGAGKEADPVKKSVDAGLGDSPSSRPKGEEKKLPKGHGNPGLSAKQNDQSKNKFGEAQVVDPKNGKDTLKEARKLAPKGDDPTTAAAVPGKILANAVMMVDPLMKAQMLKNMVKQLAKVNAAMNANSPAAAKKTVTSALFGALCILSNKYSLEKLLKVFGDCLSNGGILLLTSDHQEIVKESLAKLIQISVENKGGILPVSTIPIIAKAAIDTLVPSPFLPVAPDLYIQQYFSPEIDPCPGYIKWIGPNNDAVYTIRNEPCFASADDHVHSITEQLLAKELDYLIYKNILSPIALNLLLNNAVQKTQNNSMEKVLGNNTASKLMSLLPQLLGPLGAVVNLATGSHLPTSVLNVASMTASLNGFSKNLAMIKKMKMDSASAVSLPSGVQGLLAGAGGLGSIANLAGAAGGLGGLAGGLAGGLTAGLSGGLGDVAGGIAGAAAGGLVGGLAGGGLPTVITGSLVGGVSGALAGDLVGSAISSISGSLPNTGELQQNATNVLKTIIT